MLRKKNPKKTKNRRKKSGLQKSPRNKTIVSGKNFCDATIQLQTKKKKIINVWEDNMAKTTHRRKTTHAKKKKTTTRKKRKGFWARLTGL